MSSIPVYGQDCSIPDSKQYQDRSSVEPQSQQQLSSRPPDCLINSNCTTEESEEADKPICASGTESNNAVTDPHLQCAAPQPSRLLALPIELRRQILHLVLPFGRHRGLNGSLWHLGDTSLLRTCHQLHEEGTFVLYSSNIFQLRVRPGDYTPVVTSRVDLAPIEKFSLWFFSQPRTDIHILREFFEPLPMRLEDVWLIRRWEIYIFGIYPYMKINDCYDPFKVALVLRDRLQNLVNGILQGRQDLKMVRIVWETEECEVHSDEHRETMLKPLRDKGMAVEEVFDLW